MKTNIKYSYFGTQTNKHGCTHLLAIMKLLRQNTVEPLICVYLSFQNSARQLKYKIKWPRIPPISVIQAMPNINVKKTSGTTA